MKKVAVLLLTLALVFSVMGCSRGTLTTSGTTSKKQTNLVAVCLPTLSNPLMTSIGDSVTKKFPGKTVKVSSADSDPSKQASQVQNYITMNVDLIVIMPCDAQSMSSILAKARTQGIKVLVCGTQMSDSKAYDTMAAVNQYLVGSYCAYLTKTWVDKNYPDAANGSVPCAVLTASENQDSIDKSNGMLSAFEPYLKNTAGKYVDAKGNVVSDANKVKNPAYCPQLKLVKKADGEMADAARTTFQNILTTNPDVKVVLCCTGDGAGSVSQLYVDKKLSADQYKKISVFACGCIGTEKEEIQNTAKGSGVFRGTVAFGGADLGGEMADLSEKILSGTSQKDVWDPIALVYVDTSSALQSLTVTNAGTIQAAKVNIG